MSIEIGSWESLKTGPSIWPTKLGKIDTSNTNIQRTVWIYNRFPLGKRRNYAQYLSQSSRKRLLICRSLSNSLVKTIVFSERGVACASILQINDALHKIQIQIITFAACSIDPANTEPTDWLGFCQHNHGTHVQQPIQPLYLETWNESFALLQRADISYHKFKQWLLHSVDIGRCFVKSWWNSA